MTDRALSIATLLALVCLGNSRPEAFAAEPAVSPQRLDNPGFESFNHETGLPTSFTKAVYGATPLIGPDTRVSVEGSQSLLVAATKPSDTALAQDLTLTPGLVYRFSGSIRTQDLKPDAASWTHGTYQIQDRQGNVLARMKNHRGTTEWTRVWALFRVPADGKIRLACFFVGYGKGTGAVWFDGLKLEQVANADTLVVTARPLQRDPISPLVYGNFVELLSDLAPSMWAEKLDVTSFEYLRTPQERKLRESRFVHDPLTDPKDRLWRPLGDPASIVVEVDGDNPFNGSACQRIELKPGGDEAGIWQDGISIEKGEEYRFVGHFRTKDSPGTVFAEVRAGETVLARSPITGIGRDWQRKEVVLRASGTAAYAQFVLRITSPGTLWVDRLSLMPIKNVAGWRPDVVDAIRAMRPGILRWGGCAIERYEWKHVVGPWERRVPFANEFWGGVDPNFVGIDEFVALCRAVDAEPLICVRWSNRTPADAAELVEYCNGADHTPLGALRAKNGNAEPYGVKYWQIGNEVAGKEYDASLAAFAKAMKKADPSIHLLACYVSEDLLISAGDLIEYVSPHPYDVGNLEGTLSQIEHYGDTIRRFAPDRSIKVATTEWNTTASSWAQIERTRQVSLGNGLACARYLHLCQRHSDLVKIACRSNMSNSFYSGILQTNNRALVKTPAYHVASLYSEHGGQRPLELGDNAAVLPVDVSANLSQDGRTLTLLAVNPSGEPVDLPIDLSALGTVGSEAAVWTIADAADARDIDARNTFDRPDRIETRATKLTKAAARFQYRFPALSVTAMKFTFAETR